MSHTLTVRITSDMARWLEESAKAMGVSQGKIVRAQLEKARQEDAPPRRFMRLAGSVRLDPRLSTRKGFSKS